MISWQLCHFKSSYSKLLHFHVIYIFVSSACNYDVERDNSKIHKHNVKGVKVNNPGDLSDVYSLSKQGRRITTQKTKRMKRANVIT